MYLNSLPKEKRLATRSNLFMLSLNSSHQEKVNYNYRMVMLGLGSWFMIAWRCGPTEGSVKLSLTD